MINRSKFFAGIRITVFGGSLPQTSVNGINAILDEWDRRKLTDLRFLAYMLSTTRGECGSNMLPVREGFKSTDADARAYVKNKGYRYAVEKNGHVYYGRGLVQLTWYDNYVNMGRLLGLDLAGNPDLALRPDIAAQILFEGMLRGSFTGKSLSDYFSPSKTDWVNARRIINGTDKAEQFAAWARSFHHALVKADEPVTAQIEKKTADAVKIGSGPVAIAVVAKGVEGGWGVLEWVVVLVIVAASAGAGWLGWRWWKKHKLAKAVPDAPALLEIAPIETPIVAKKKPKKRKKAVVRRKKKKAV